MMPTSSTSTATRTVPGLHNPARSNNDIFDMAGNDKLVNDAWHTNISEINGARYYQVRLTFRSNIVTNRVPGIRFGLLVV
ncbi:MAG: hypothetical protein R3F17_11130 [Planctomycetota bacterium]